MRRRPSAWGSSLRCACAWVLINSEDVLFYYYNAVVEPGRPAWRAIVGHFREEILQEDGTINRERLGSIVFNDESKRKTLNRCTHPYIRREVLWELAKHFSKGISMHQPALDSAVVVLFSCCVYFVCVCVLIGSSYVVLVSPLLFETKYALRYMRQTIVVSW